MPTEPVALGLRRSGAWLEAGTTVLVSLLIGRFLYLVGRPLFTDDAWWHLSLGRAFATSGPWLSADPVLHTSSAPPIPSAWLFDVAMYAASLPFGLNGLRALHVCIVAGMLVAAWAALRRASHSALVASAGIGVWLALSAYRLAQLRPELATIGAALVLFLVLLAPHGVPSWTRVAGAAALAALWANLHPGFPLGPVSIAAAAAGVVAERVLRRGAPDPLLGRRAFRLAVASLVCAGATLLNPIGLAAHLLYFDAGKGAPAMSLVADEWTPLDPFRLPPSNLPPSPLGWLVFWAMALLTLGVIAVVLRDWRQPGSGARRPLGEISGALIPLALLGLVAPLFAVRFLWLGFFPLFLLARAARVWIASWPNARWLTAGFACLMLPAFHSVGDGPLLARGVSLATYREPYDALKYHAHPVAFLRDSGLEGNLYNSYFMGGFLGYWLQPRLRTFIDGSLHVAPQVMEDYLALQLNADGTSSFSPTPLLDRYAVDIYLGIGFPTPPLAHRPWRHTALHLADDPDWILVFRSMQSAVYLRRNDRNQANLVRVARYYAEAGLAFDPERGVDVVRLIDDAPDWAVDHGLVPRDFAQLLRETRSGASPHALRGPLATAYLALGLDERALEVDRSAVERVPSAIAPRRRRLGALLRLGRVAEAQQEAEALASLHPTDGLSLALIATARAGHDLSDPSLRSSASRLPVLSRAEARRLRSARAQPDLL